MLIFSLDLGGEKLKRFIIIVTVCVIVFCPSVLFAQDQIAPAGNNGESDVSQADVPSAINENQFIIGGAAAEGEEDETAGESLIFLILRMLLVLVLAAAAIYGLVFFIKKLSNPKKTQDPYLKILSSASLGPNRSVHVISLGEKAWLVGAADNSVSLISEIDDKETIDAMLLDDSRNTANGSMGKFIDFRSIFMRLSGTQDTKTLPGSESLKERRKRFKGF